MNTKKYVQGEIDTLVSVIRDYLDGNKLDPNMPYESIQLTWTDAAQESYAMKMTKEDGRISTVLERTVPKDIGLVLQGQGFIKD
jgi:methionyl-tRNA formyltransferase